MSGHFDLASSLLEDERTSEGHERKSAGNDRAFADTHQNNCPIERFFQLSFFWGEMSVFVLLETAKYGNKFPGKT